MYCAFYNLRERPFNVTSDPSFFFLSRKHKEALAHLVYGTSQRKGIMVITGEIGTGKTTLCRFFLNQLGREIKTAFILNPYLSEIELLGAIVKDFGIPSRAKERLALINELNSFLLKESEAGNNVVLIIDEAQNLKSHQLEQVRLLSNLETEKSKLLQIVLVGQPELNKRLGLPSLRQLQQRIMVRCHITPLEEDETQEYIEYRLRTAGSSGRISFSHEALRAIHGFSGGVPRLINMICDRALLAGFVEETDRIDQGIIGRCMEELRPEYAGERN